MALRIRRLEGTVLRLDVEVVLMRQPVLRNAACCAHKSWRANLPDLACQLARFGVLCRRTQRAVLAEALLCINGSPVKHAFLL